MNNTKAQAGQGAATPRPDHLWIVPELAPTPAATPCPPWCVGEHEADDPNPSLHFGPIVWTGFLGLYMHQDAGVTSVCAVHESGAFSLIDATEAHEAARSLLKFANDAAPVTA